MQPDTMIRMPGATIQHGPASDRVYLMKLATSDVPRIIRFMEELALDRGYSKLFAKVPGQAEGWFHANGFKVEARVPGMFCGERDGCFMAKYPKRERSRIRDPKSVEDVLETATRQTGRSAARALPEGWAAKSLGPDDADAMAETFRAVFETYPFPIHDPGYLRSTMAADVRYFGVLDGKGRLVAISSAEMDPNGSNAEMTDFATLEDFRGRGLAGRLLAHMEREMRKLGIRTAYTIARAHATGMNIVFARQGYVFAGTLPNNTQIKGGLESMNVWFKHLAKHEKRFDFSYSIRWNLLLITTGAILYSYAFKSIALPQQFIPGGIFGLGSLIYYGTGWLSPGIFFFLLNLPFFALGWFKLSPRFVLYSLYGMVVATVSYEFIGTTLNIHNQLYAAVACGVLSGLGGGLILRSLGSGGGLDIIAVYLYQTYNIGVGKVYFASNVALYLLCLAFMPIDLVIVSMIMVFISSVLVDQTLALFSQRKVVFIVSDHSDAIAQTVLDSMKQSATFLKGMGAFSKREKNVLMTVVNNIQLKKLEQITFTHDPQALFIVENTFSVLGSSFSKRKIY